MQTNLAYTGLGTQGDTTFISGDAAPAANNAIPQWLPTPSSYPLFSTGEPSLATGSDTGVQYGFLYNWCATSGAQSSACSNSATTASIDAGVSICPAGWRIPTADEFVALNDELNGGQTWFPDPTDNGLISDWLGVFAGSWTGQGNTFWGTGGAGMYWAMSATNGAAMFDFNETDVSPPSSSVMTSSYAAIRCVAEEPPLLMQQVTIDNCPTDRTMAVDARDERTYWIRRIPNTREGGGDLCWMQTNLAYGGGGNNRFGDVVNLTEIDDGETWSFTEAFFMVPASANPTTYPGMPSTATDGGAMAGRRQFGYFYNWCAAMGGPSLNPGACQTAVAVQPSQNTSICPAGWRLPTGGSGGEFELLNNEVNEGWTNIDNVGGDWQWGDPIDIGLLRNWLGMRTGQWEAGVGFFSTDGNYWSSNIADSTTAQILTFNPHGVGLSPMTRTMGAPMRCVRE
jgi:uncharacterized protein (TIGR02145 family)